MWNISELVIAFLISCTASLLVTPIIIKLALKIKVVDKPDNNRKMHNGTKPSMGGLAIFIGVAAGFIYLQPVHDQLNAIIIGACIMLITGFLDDLFEIRALYKLIGQTAAAIVVVSSGLVIEKLTIPFMGTVYIDNLGIVLTIIWILAASNAINLIDGLDGLAAGVSAIGLASILVMAVMDYRIVVVYLSVILIGSCLGFLYHNFYPAKIFMGDTGALFLGYSIAIVAMLGLFKNVAFFSFIVPIIVIAIPVFDTILAIIRRSMNKQGIATADKKHIHYQLMQMGYSHRASVLIIYAFSTFFGLMAIIFNSATLLTSLVVMVIIILGIQLIAEIAGVTIHNRQPLLDGLRRLVGIKRVGRQD
ncbi:MraY family glycosyltransferase [Virgibacillus sp. C22-A2]|uniref:MraY family glycosyltransferase n=1 Tax=Virgibacillus tibetensis TaxID=3042313 RepID=A0ABU6KEB8_9BACI|nr:MraY family glycosyltransferase [Virgibacillus sp. C22-A2]